MNLDESVGLVRYLRSLGQTKEEAITNQAIPIELCNAIRARLEKEENIILEPARVISTKESDNNWLQQMDRSTWYYWPTLRRYLLSKWSEARVRSLDNDTDRILQRFNHPNNEKFDVRGLVIGYIQSGKTANYTALIAKAVDCGYRLIIVLSGIDNGLRRQTQIRLEKELLGLSEISSDSVQLPPPGKQWHKFTTTDFEGDFNPGNENAAVLQGHEPILLVIKKNGTVLRRLLNWLKDAPENLKQTIPTLIIDDECDLASIDTRGSYQTENDQPSPDSDEPSIINGLIRSLLNCFQKKVYAAYTATPFANILIPYDAYNPQKLDDLYPKNFIIDLPKPPGYFGADELFGESELTSGEQGLNCIREINEKDLQMLENNEIPICLENAILSFVLAGATRAQRGESKKPATMLIHLSHLTALQKQIKDAVEQKVSTFKDELRYSPSQGIITRLHSLWESDFRPVTKASYNEKDIDFDEIKPYIGPFFEAIKIKTVNSFTGEVLDYEANPELKAIAIGGNKLSRGLTLEGLLVSFFTRSTNMYDTLMQMGRWFGFREGYADLTRIWTTIELSEWFSDLANVEKTLREDIKIYEDLDYLPSEVGMRILCHPVMQVTSATKRRHAKIINITQSYSGQIVQTFKFPFNKPEVLSAQADENYSTVLTFLSDLGKPTEWDKNGPIWTEIPVNKVLQFLTKFKQDDLAENTSISLPLINSYIEHQTSVGELIKWTIAVRGRDSKDEKLGEAFWEIPQGRIWQISRTRKKYSNTSIGTLTSAKDETIGLSDDAITEKINEFNEKNHEIGVREAARILRKPEEGLILIYPVSKNSGHSTETVNTTTRQPLFENPADQNAKDLIGLAISFPFTQKPQPVQAYWQGELGWRPVQ
jgi:hypothetical protein